jgi:hypothetical protein
VPLGWPLGRPVGVGVSWKGRSALHEAIKAGTPNEGEIFVAIPIALSRMTALPASGYRTGP